MKKAGKSEPQCRRQEFVCRLHDVVKDLDRSLKSDCDQGAGRFARENGNPFEPRQKKVGNNNLKNGSECCCQPGCCQESLKFKVSRIPNYPGTEGARNQEKSVGGAQTNVQEPPGQYIWHQPDHSNGCWPGHDHTAQSQREGFHIPSDPEKAKCCFIARSK
ncbi:uncharacterized protein LOC128997325 [Macrosteles quadrilineatus]|uniref:uncharacterized protein LOC128997325 n=1 Tax=Macrosteles quadrilineatus TaxID=74068 RepID=UPI0023E15A8F|nr:uncharacterized protein LOC128997325 [Macrosteles quadrilineatus]